MNNSGEIRTALETLKTRDIVVPIWDRATGQGANLRYHVVGFATVRITDYALPGQNCISIIYKGMVSCTP